MDKDRDRIIDYLNKDATEVVSGGGIARLFVGGAILVATAVLCLFLLHFGTESISARNTLRAVMGAFAVFVLTPTTAAIGIWAFRHNVFPKAVSKGRSTSW